MPAVRVMQTIHMARPEMANEISASAMHDIVGLKFGQDVTVILRDLAVVDALSAAVAEARALLEAMQ